MDQSKEYVLVSQGVMKGILEEVFQVVGLNVGKALDTYLH